MVGGVRDQRVDVGGAEPVDDRGDRLTEGTGAAAVAPGVGHDYALGLRGGSDAYAESGGAGLGGHPAHESRDETRQRALTEAAHRCVGAQGGDTEAFREALRASIENVKDLPVSHGVINMTPTDHNGFDTRARVMVQIVDGKWKLQAE